MQDAAASFMAMMHYLPPPPFCPSPPVTSTSSQVLLHMSKLSQLTVFLLERVNLHQDERNAVVNGAGTRGGVSPKP